MHNAPQRRPRAENAADALTILPLFFRLPHRNAAPSAPLVWVGAAITSD